MLSSSTVIWAQVGINNPNPTATLDVNGGVSAEGKLFLENPGNSTQIRGSKLLIKKINEQVVQYDIDKSKYGPINYVQFIFRNTNTHGLQDYDTKISATKYLVTVQGFYFLIAHPVNSTNVTVRSERDNSKVEGFQMYAYIDTFTQTWHIKGFVNNSTFQYNSADGNIDLYMNLIIFRNGLIAKPLDDVEVNMGNSDTLTAPLPTEFLPYTPE